MEKQILIFSSYVTCFRNVVNAQRVSSKLPLIQLTDVCWANTFKSAALEPDFSKFLDFVMLKSDAANKYSEGKAVRAWKVGWLLARTFADNFQPVKQEEDTTQEKPEDAIAKNKETENA